MGLSPAAILAEKMSAGFPSIKYFLLVGIAGGVPSYGSAGAVSEIVLGDVVVSSPRGNHGGVMQYDKGSWQGQGRLHFRGYTNGLPGDLLAAVNNFRAEGLSRHKIPEILKHMRLKLDEKRQHQYNDPGPNRDRLYNDNYAHQGTEHDDCKEVCDADYTRSRYERGEGAIRQPDEPFVHFGNIASSNQLQISAVERERVRLEHEVICFEMEAAGVMEEHPCVVIRGICDYADSHKNKGWQNFAAATAAACAKALLLMIPAADDTTPVEPSKPAPSASTPQSSSLMIGDHNRDSNIVDNRGSVREYRLGDANSGFQAFSVYGPVSNTFNTRTGMSRESP
jgi:nucleoside phosphorylase